MTRRDYELIAGAIGSVVDNYYGDGVGMIREVVLELCRKLRENNPRFDEVRFTKACGF